jgi:hypothetical protein
MHNLVLPLVQKGWDLRLAVPVQKKTVKLLPVKMENHRDIRPLLPTIKKHPLPKAILLPPKAVLVTLPKVVPGILPKAILVLLLRAVLVLLRKLLPAH